jgi:hypothetical protein
MLKWPFSRGTSGGERAILALAGKMLLQGEIVLVFQFITIVNLGPDYIQR